MAGLIEAHGLSKTYGRRGRGTPAVSGVDLEVERGALHVLMGLSGSGKSTLLRMLNRLVEPTQGRVLLDGQDLAALGPRELRQVRNGRISMVFQHFALFPHRSVRDNAAYGLHLRGVPRRQAAEAAQTSLELVGLDGWGDARPGELSGGMKQRVGLARALSTDAEVLLMDEPFSALDPLIRREMQDLLVSLSRRLDRTVVFVTHDLNEAMRLGDTVTLLHAGRVAQTGSTAEILGGPADDYVRRFVREVDRLRVLTVADVMTTEVAAEPYDPALALAPGASLQEVVARLHRAPAGGLPVVGDGVLVGRLTANDVLGAVGLQERAA